MDRTYLSDTQVAARFSVSRATVWRWIRSSEFPQPVKLSPGCTRWRLADVEKWETALGGASAGRPARRLGPVKPGRALQ